MVVDTEYLKVPSEELKEIRKELSELRKDVKFLREEREKTAINRLKGKREEYATLIREFIRYREEDNTLERGIIPAKELFKTFNKWQEESNGFALDISDRFFGNIIGENYTRIRKDYGSAYMDVPIKAKGKIKGNIELFVEDMNTGEYMCKQVGAKLLYEIYKKWCWTNGESPTTKNQFGAIIKNFYEKKRITGGYVYLNVTLLRELEGGN